MKFTKGYWMNKPGVVNHDAVQVREVKAEKDRVYLYTVPYAADMRAMGGPVLEMFVSSPQPDIIRIEAYHFMGSNQKMPSFELNDAHCELELRPKSSPRRSRKTLSARGNGSDFGPQDSPAEIGKANSCVGDMTPLFWANYNFTLSPEFNSLLQKHRQGKNQHM